MSYALEIKNLTVRYPGYTHTAVENVSFVVEENRIAALIGPNGSGKSTIIKAILGLIDYQGEIRVFGKPVKNMYYKIGFVPQRFSFDPTFPITAEEFIFFTLSNTQLSNQKKQRFVQKALDSVNALELSERRLSTLSGGQLQKVLLARAIVNEPTLLLLDEPEAGVDVGGEQTFYDLLENLVKNKALTALVASHELDVVYTYADQVICVNKRMFCTGVPHEVLNQEMFIKLYGRGLKFYGHDRHPHTHPRRLKQND